VLLDQGQELTVLTTREYLMKSLDPEMRGQIKAITDIDIQHMYYDWNLDRQTGVFVDVGPSIVSKGKDSESDYKGKEKVHEDIISISRQAEKAPDRVESYMLGTRTLVVIREGILVPIEKQLIALGFVETLRVAKRQLEGEMLSNDIHFPAILEAELQDVFVDWNFELDNSVISFILNPMMYKAVMNRTNCAGHKPKRTGDPVLFGFFFCISADFAVGLLRPIKNRRVSWHRNSQRPA
jgi:uncharacterized protein YbcI